jgi:hypothetical protein
MAVTVNVPAEFTVKVVLFPLVMAGGVPTVCGTPVDILLLKLLSPLYFAVMVFEPVVVEVRLHVAAATLPVQLSVPSLTVTVSVPGIVPPPGAVIATL